jgi:hypothetical protein
MRTELSTNQDLSRRVAEIEKTLIIGHDTALRDLYNKIRPLLAGQRNRSVAKSPFT